MDTEPDKTLAPKYATTKNQLIQAIAGKHFRFRSVAQAQKKLQELARTFSVTQKHRPENAHADAVVMWIKNFDTTEKDTNKGYKGNFALIEWKELPGKKFTLTATKLDVDVKQHPQQQRLKTSHPNWGHPILRSIKKGKIYSSIAAAEKDLQLLHEEYPTTTIPLGNRLNIMIYSKTFADDKPIKKHLLEIKSNSEGKLFIEIAVRAEKKEAIPENAASAPKPPMPKMPGKQQPPAETIGKFTALVQLRRNKKKK